MAAQLHIVHPAVAIVERTERLWQNDPGIASDRARLIVQRLIETGHLEGSIRLDMPLASGPSDG